MNFDLKFVVMIYILFVILLYIYKPELFQTKNNSKKIIYICFLLFILAIISYYIKIIFEYVL